jgi:hypothetical protein
MFALCPDDIGVILTYRCHGGCAHCIYKETSSPMDIRVAASGDN